MSTHRHEKGDPMATASQDVNMADVAARAGVSIASVSRALRGAPGVGEATRSRILDLAAELSYVVSPEASRLAGGSTNRVALVVPRMELWFYAHTVAVLERELRAADLDVLLYVLDGPEERSRFFRDLPTRRKVDAVVVVALPLLGNEAARLADLGVHVVVAGGKLLDHPRVCVDDLAIARLAVTHLTDLGHRRIAMIRVGDPDQDAHWSADEDRVRGYRDGLAAAGLEAVDDLVVTVPFDTSAGAVGMAELLTRRSRPTAVLAFSDEIAIGALCLLQREGLRVPEDMSVLGIDDHPLAALFDLTTVRQHVTVQAQKAAETAIRLLSGEPPLDESVVIPHELVVRGTTAPPPG
jgi:LacI family repressor for deo operon, udp, cdd, tsx, nupC, and nupG